MTASRKMSCVFGPIESKRVGNPPHISSESESEREIKGELNDARGWIILDSLQLSLLFAICRYDGVKE